MIKNPMSKLRYLPKWMFFAIFVAFFVLFLLLLQAHLPGSLRYNLFFILCDPLPAKVEIKPQIQHLHISSAYFVTDTDSDGNSTKAIRMIVIGESSIEDLPFSCNIDGRSVAPFFKNTRGHPHCKFLTSVIDCEADTLPRSFSLVGLDKEEHNLAITVPDSTSRKLVVCFSRMFYYEKWQTALAALELYKLLSADLMVIPISSVIEKLYRILKAYEKEGTVRLKPSVYIPQFSGLDYDPNAETEWFHQITAYTECLYDYRDSADFILNIDMDDFLIPKYGDSLPMQLASLAEIFPMVASFEFHWALATSIGSNSTDEFSISRMIKKSNIGMPPVPYGKTVIRPKRLLISYVHHPNETPDANETLPVFTHQLLNPSYTLTIHMRCFASDEKPLPDQDNYFSSRPVFSKLDTNFHEFLERNPEAKQAYMELPAEYSYQPSMVDCHKEIGARLGNGTMSYCTNALKCAPKANGKMERCTVLKQEYQHTKISKSFHISSPVSSNFEMRPNCLL